MLLPAVKFLRRSMLTAAFGVAALQGISPATAQETPAHQTQYVQELDGLRSYYQSRMPNRQRIVVLPQDVTRTQPRWDTSHTVINSYMRTQGVEMSWPELRALGFRLLTGTQGNPYSLFNSSLRHSDLPNEDLIHNVILPAAMTFRETSANPDDAFCLILPQDRDFLTFSVDGLSQEQNVRLFNRHEFWHCLEVEEGNARRSSPLRLQDYERSARVQEAEIFADLGAVSDMIALDGEDTSIIRKIARWRLENLNGLEGHDIEHYSGRALLALEQEIARTGLDAFRAMDHEGRRRIVERLTRAHRLDRAELRDYLNAVIDLKKGKTPPRLSAKVGAYLADWQTAQSSPPPTRNYIQLTEAERQQLQNWNIRAELTAAATPAGGGEITPQSLLAARNRLLDRQRAEISRNPTDRLGGAKIIKLEQAFQHVFALNWAPAFYRPEEPARSSSPAPATRPAS